MWIDLTEKTAQASPVHVQVSNIAYVLSDGNSANLYLVGGQVIAVSQTYAQVLALVIPPPPPPAT
jgi:hypothetical protein